MIKQFVMTLVMAGIAFAAMASLSACNTVEGFGQDVESAGEAIEDAGK